MVAEVTVAVDPDISVSDGHHIAQDVDHNLMHRLPYLSNATVHVYPETASGEDRHPHRGISDDRQDDPDEGAGHDHGRQDDPRDDNYEGEGHEHGRQDDRRDDHDESEGHEHGR